MENFKVIKDLPTYDLLPELNNLLDSGKIKWHKDNNQISLNTIEGKDDDFLFGCGSLYYDWDNKVIVKDKHGNETFEVKERDVPLKESDFNVLCSQFIGTSFEVVYNELKTKYSVGRVRLMRSRPKTCLSWHVDDSQRLHYPIKTQEGCLMVIEDQVKHLNQNEWCFTNTLVKHTAFNGSKDFRIHLVATII